MMQVRIRDTCGRCNGSGELGAGLATVKCAACKGAGREEEWISLEDLAVEVQEALVRMKQEPA